LGLVVTGISQDGNIAALEKALGDAGLPLDSIQVIGPDDSDTHLAGGLANSGIILGDMGTAVPGSGLTGPRPFFRNESLSDRLNDFEIPDDEVDNYVEALQAGRSIVAYFAKERTLGQVEEIFKASPSLTKVKTF
jgi:hypothetical protein